MPKFATFVVVVVVVTSSCKKPRPQESKTRKEFNSFLQPPSSPCWQATSTPNCVYMERVGSINICFSSVPLLPLLHPLCSRVILITPKRAARTCRKQNRKRQKKKKYKIKKEKYPEPTICKATPDSTLPAGLLCFWHLCNDLARHVITHTQRVRGRKRWRRGSERIWPEGGAC